MKALTRRPLSILLAASALVLALAACGSSEDTRAGGSGTPGYDGSSTSVDRSPFELANPTTTDGATTVPGPDPTLPMPDVFETTTTAGPSAGAGTGAAGGKGASRGAAPPATLEPVADPGASTPVCEAFAVMAKAGRDVQIRFAYDPNSDFVTARDRVVQGFNEAINSLAPQVDQGPDPNSARTFLNRLIAMKSLAESATTIDQGGRVFLPLQQPRGPGEAAGWTEILAHMNRYCASVPRSFDVAI